MARRTKSVRSGGDRNPQGRGQEELRDEIGRRAYFKYCDRGCVPGAAIDDWLAAEREVLEEQKAGKKQSRR